MAQEVLRRPARLPFCGSPLLKERGRGREREILTLLLTIRLREVEKEEEYLFWGRIDQFESRGSPVVVVESARPNVYIHALTKTEGAMPP